MKKHTSIIFILAMVCSYGAYGATETINWYSEGTVYDTTTCESGGDITLPTPPSKNGYVFLGWAKKCSIKNLDATKGRLDRTVGSKSWSTTFDFGTISGVSRCSSIDGGTAGTNGDPTATADNGIYCWCKINNANYDTSDCVSDGTTEEGLWTFCKKMVSAADCNVNCAGNCANAFCAGDGYQYRKGLYGQN